MSWLIQRSDLRFVCCYMTDEGVSRDFANAFPNLARPEWPAIENFDHSRHWVVNLAGLRGAGWFVLPLFFGYDWPKSKNLTPTARAGLIHARMAKFLAQRHGFPPGSVVYIDDEASERDLTPGELTYFTAYFTELARQGPAQYPDPQVPPPGVAYRPGYYGHNKTAAQLLLGTPDLCVWSDDFHTHGRHAVAGSGDMRGDLLPLSSLDRAAIPPADVGRTPMKTTYPTDIDARVHPIEGTSSARPAQIHGNLWPVLLQRWWTQGIPLPEKAPASDPAWPPHTRRVASWDFNESLSRDPSNPAAHVRVGACRFGGEAHFGEVFAQDTAWRSGQLPVEGVRGSVLVNRFPLNGTAGQCLEAGDGRPQHESTWPGPYVHPFSPVAGADGVPALVFVTTTGHLALYHTPTQKLRMLTPADRNRTANPSADPWRVRLPHAVAVLPDTPSVATIVWVGADQRLWRASVPLAAGDIAGPSVIRNDLMVHPAARVAAAHRGPASLLVSVLPDGTLFRTDPGGAVPATFGAVLASGPLAAAASPVGDAIVVAQLRDHRLAASSFSGSTWSALAPVPAPPASALVQPLAGVGAAPGATGFHVAAPASDLKLYEWNVQSTGASSPPTALSPPGMPTVHPFSDLAPVAHAGTVMYACARCEGGAGPIGVSATRLDAL